MLPVLHTQKNLSAVFSFVCGGFQEKAAEYSLAVSQQTARNEKKKIDMFHSKHALLT